MAFFFATSYAVVFTATASSMGFFTAAASATSFTAAALVAAAVSPIVELMSGPPPLGVVARATANEAGHGTEAAEGAHQPLICLCQVPSSASAVKHHHQMILHHPLSLAGGRSGDSTALATHGTCPGDLYTLGLVTPMDRCNADIVHRRHCHPQQLPCGLVHAEWLVGHWRGDKAVGRRIGVSFPITSVNASSPSVDPSPRSSHVMLFTPV
jgi:hypothetical protein